MRSSMFTLGLFLAGSLAANVSAADARQMSFFITSTGPGNGANLGGLEVRIDTARSWQTLQVLETKLGERTSAPRVRTSRTQTSSTREIGLVAALGITPRAC